MPGFHLDAEDTYMTSVLPSEDVASESQAVCVLSGVGGGHIRNEHIWRITEDCLKKKTTKPNPNGTGSICSPNCVVDGL